jgi:hypothetical protein
VKRRSKVAIIGSVAIIAFVLLIPVVLVSYALPLTSVDCTNSNAQLTSLCASIQMKGYASITYWLFGHVGFYETLPSAGYSLSL